MKSSVLIAVLAATLIGCGRSAPAVEHASADCEHLLYRAFAVYGDGESIMRTHASEEWKREQAWPYYVRADSLRQAYVACSNS